MDKASIKTKIKKLTVLFVDDEQVVIEIMKNILPMLFKDTYYALNGLEGINQYKKYSPDIIITDLSMPKLDGVEMIKEIKKINDNVKIICISGHNEVENLMICENLGCSYIVKPINSTVLFEAFGKVLGK